MPDNTPESTWPEKGEVKMENVQLRYRPELPPVLVDVTADIQGGEKLGVVGRTGAGNKKQKCNYESNFVKHEKMTFILFLII